MFKYVMVSFFCVWILYFIIAFSVIWIRISKKHKDLSLGDIFFPNEDILKELKANGRWFAIGAGITFLVVVFGVFSIMVMFG